MIQKAGLIMSSFMMKAESIANIADFISTVFNDKNNNTHIRAQGINSPIMQPVRTLKNNALKKSGRYFLYQIAGYL